MFLLDFSLFLNLYHFPFYFCFIVPLTDLLELRETACLHVHVRFNIWTDILLHLASNSFGNLTTLLIVSVSASSTLFITAGKKV